MLYIHSSRMNGLRPPKHWRYNNNKTQCCPQGGHSPAGSRALAGRLSAEPGGWTPTWRPTFTSPALTALLSSSRIRPAIRLKFLGGWESQTEISVLLSTCSSLLVRSLRRSGLKSRHRLASPSWAHPAPGRQVL